MPSNINGRNTLVAWLEKQKINTEGDFGRGYDCGYQAGYAVAMNEMKPKNATATLDSEKQKEPEDKGEISDGYHTFNELYYYRMLYNAAFFNLLPKEWVHKSKRHHDGEECFGGGWFIVMANLPTGQISNHYELKDWDLFQIPEKKIADEWDGHTPQEAAERLHKYLQEKQKEQKELPLMDGNADLYFDEWNQQNQNPTKRQCFEEGMRYAESLQKDKCAACAKRTEGYIDGRIDAEKDFAERAGIIMAPLDKKEQKPAWSEEDEKVVKSIINYLSYDGTQAILTEEIDEWIAWLKSLRPSWKPIPEQLEAMEFVIRDYREDGCTATANYLQEIFDKIKKL